MRIGLLAAAGWVVAALLTVGASWSAVAVVRDAVVPTTVVATGLPTPEETLPGSATPGPTRSPSAPATRSPAATRSVLASGQGGTALVRCTAGTPEFYNVTPRQGYQARTDDSPGEIEFRSEAHRTEVTATCAGGIPRAAVEEKGGSDGSGRGGDDD